MRLAGAGGAGDQQGRSERDAPGAARAGPCGEGHFVNPGGNLLVTSEGVAVARWDACLGQFQCGHPLRRRLGGCGGRVDAPVGEDRVEAGCQGADALRLPAGGGCGHS